MTEPAHAAADVVEVPTASSPLGTVTAEVFAGEAHLGGDTAAAFDVDVGPETHYPNEVELRVAVDGLEVLVGLDERTVRQLREVLDGTLAETQEGPEHE